LAHLQLHQLCGPVRLLLVLALRQRDLGFARQHAQAADQLSGVDRALQRRLQGQQLLALGGGWGLCPVCRALQRSLIEFDAYPHKLVARRQQQPVVRGRCQRQSRQRQGDRPPVAPQLDL
jgi:hypothetical protein